VRGIDATTYTEFETGFINNWNPFNEQTTADILREAIENAPFAYNGEFLPVSVNAQNDVNELLEYVKLPENCTFYETIN